MPFRVDFASSAPLAESASFLELMHNGLPLLTRFVAIGKSGFALYQQIMGPMREALGHDTNSSVAIV